MKKAIISIGIAGLVMALGIGPSRGQDKGNVSESEREQVNKKVEAVNDAARKQGMMDVALKRISTQTGVPLETVQELHKKHPDIRAGGLLVACVLAAETKKTPEDFLKRRDDKGWAAVARENNVPLEKLTVRLDNVARELQSAPPAKEKKKND